MKGVITLCFLAILPVFAEKAPNILLVLSDDHSVPHMGCYGDANVKTPNFDKFAAQSMRFTRAYTTASQCAPSRKSILSGRSPVGLQQTLFTLPLQQDVVLFPQILREKAGYYTGLVGRSHHLDGNAKDPLSIEIFEKHKLQNITERFDVVMKSANKNGEKAGRMSLGQYTDFLNGAPEGKPFFLQLCFHDPHRGWDEARIPSSTIQRH